MGVQVSDNAMEQLTAQLLETARAMWRRRWLGIIVAWIVGIVAAIALMLVRDRYEATSRVYVDTKTVLRPLMHDLTVELDLDQTVGLLARTLITRPNIELLMRRSGLETSDMSPIARNSVAEGLLRDIKLNAVGRDNVFAFSYRDTNPERARLVVQNLVSLFLESDSGAKKRDAEAARGFIDEQIKHYETRLAEAENRLKEFKLRNLGMADNSGKDYFQRMAALTEEMNKLSGELKAAEQARDALKRELQGDSVSLVPDVSAASTVVTAPEYDARLESQRRQLDEMLRRYTDQHPDVIATKKLVERLEQEKEHELEVRRKAAASKPARASAPTNTVQQQIKLALAEAEANVASLRSRYADMQAKHGQLRASASRVPQIEAELTQLNRDYEVVRSTYQNMLAKREKASLSEDVDASRSAQFRVIDPPRTAPQPVFPNRMALAPAVLLLALVAGMAATFLAVQLVPTVENARMLRMLTQRPVLGSVSMLMNDERTRRTRRELMRFGSALGSLFVVAGIWLVWISMQTHL